MDSSFTVKPRDSASRVVYDRTSTVRTDLSPTQSVRAPDVVPPLRNGQGPSDLTPRGVAIDPQSQDVIRRARDEDERRKRQKHSDEALSRMRAYRPSQSEAGPDPDPDHPHADVKV
jgi:hypothetical protein